MIDMRHGKTQAASAAAAGAWSWRSEGVAPMASLRDQFLKSGLIDQKKVRSAVQEKSKQIKVERQTGTQAVDEAQQAALEAQRLKAERARELNAQRDAAARQKAIAAQIIQMVKQSRQSRGKGDIAYNFAHHGKIKRIHVSAEVQGHLVAGRLMIVAQGETIELVPGNIADKIAERDPSMVVRVHRSSTALAEDDPYAEYKVPDDLMW
jgi:uncharacterized protein YaiL (DUF2058 family)